MQTKPVLHVFHFVSDLAFSLVWINSSHVSHESPPEVMTPVCVRVGKGDNGHKL